MPRLTAHLRLRRAVCAALLLGAAVLAACGVPATPAAPTALPPTAAPASPSTSHLDPATAKLSENGLFRASFTVEGPTVPVNELHTWTLHVETPEGAPIDDAEIQVDGDMPEHGHGLPTRPEVTQSLGNGDYLVEGMKFQMGGFWVIDFDITAAGQTDRVRFELTLEP